MRRSGVWAAIISRTCGGTNAVVHLLALAGRAGVPLTLDRFHELSSRTPLLANVLPSGEYLVEDLAYQAAYGTFEALEREIGERGLAFPYLPPSPVQELIQRWLGVPLPASTQRELVRDAGGSVRHQWARCHGGIGSWRRAIPAGRF